MTAIESIEIWTASEDILADVDGLDVDATMLRYCNLLEAELTEAFPDATVAVHWGQGRSTVNGSPVWPGGGDPEIEQVQSVLENVFEDGDWYVEV